jgi:hypothetical protein
MQKRLPIVIAAATFGLLLLSSMSASPARAAGGAVPPGAAHIVAPPYALATEPVWATINAAAQGNYPGGNERFDVFVVDSAVPPEGNITILNATVSTTAWSGSNSNGAVGALPTQIAPGQQILLTIYLPIPSDFTLSNFTATLNANVDVTNGTGSHINFIPLKLTGSIPVFMLALPGQGSQSSQASQTTADTIGSTSGGTVSTTVFAAGVAVPSIIAIVLLAMLARRGSRP